MFFLAVTRIEDGLRCLASDASSQVQSIQIELSTAVPAQDDQTEELGFTCNRR